MDDLKEYDQETMSALIRNDSPKLVILNYYDMLLGKFIKENFSSQDVNAGFIPSSAIISFKSLVQAKYAILYPELATDKKFAIAHQEIINLFDSLKTNEMESDKDERRFLDDVFDIMNRLSLVQSQKIMPTRRDVRINIRGDPLKIRDDE